MADEITTLLRNLPKNRDIEVEKRPNGHHAVKYKGTVVAHLPGTPKDRNATRSVLSELSRKTGLVFDRKGRVKGSTVRVISGRGTGADVIRIPAEMASELDGDLDLVPPKHQPLTLPPSAVPRPVDDQEDDDVVLEWNRPAPPEREEDMEWGRAPVPAVEEPDNKEQTVAAETADETADETPRRQRKKRPPMDVESVNARREFVESQLIEHSPREYTPVELHDLLQSVGEDLGLSGVRMMCNVLEGEGRISRRKVGNGSLWFVPEDDPRVLAYRSQREDEATTAAPQEEPAPPPVETEPTTPEPTPEPVAQPAERPDPFDEVERSPAYQAFLAGKQARESQPESTLARIDAALAQASSLGHGLPSTAALEAENEELRRENQILRRMVMRARGLTEEQFKMALDLAREMADQ